MSQGQIPTDDQATQYRRTEKAWMNRDAERSWWQFTFSSVGTAQSVFVAVLGLASTIGGKVDGGELQIVIGLVGLVLPLLVILSGWRLFIDGARAKQYEDQVKAAEQKKLFDNNTADATYKRQNLLWRGLATSVVVLSVVSIIYSLYVLSRAVA